MKRKISPIFLGLMVVISSCQKNENQDNQPQVESNCLPANLQTDLIAYYPFSSGNINDFSGNGVHLVNTTTAHATSDRNGNPNCAFQFLNTSSNIEFLEGTQTAALDGMSVYSISLWYEAEDTTRNGNDYEALVSRGEGLSCPNRFGQWSVGLYDCRKAVFGRENSVWDADLISADCQDQINQRTNGWHHVVAIYDNGNMRIYRDGILQDSDSGPGGCIPAPTVQDLGSLFLGKQYTGKIDDVLIYSRALTQAEVNQLHTAESCCE